MMAGSTRRTVELLRVLTPPRTTYSASRRRASTDTLRGRTLTEYVTVVTPSAGTMRLSARQESTPLVVERVESRLRVSAGDQSFELSLDEARDLAARLVEAVRGRKRDPRRTR